MTTPRQKPRGESEQTVGTPPEFIKAIESRFWPIDIDLAATKQNAICERWLGPGGEYDDALVAPWYRLNIMFAYLNPPYAKIRTWAEKCVEESRLGLPIAFLTPASVDASWYREVVRPNAFVLTLLPRLQFVGHDAAYPKGLFLSIFTPEGFVGQDDWHWKKPWPPIRGLDKIAVLPSAG